MDIIYFELNNWACGRDYPENEPFLTWFEDDDNLYFSNEDWVKENKLVVVETLVDMSVNYCISAPREWVEKNCPELLTKYTKFIKTPEDGEILPKSTWAHFMEYKEENIGIEEDNSYWGPIMERWEKEKKAKENENK